MVVFREAYTAELPSQPTCFSGARSARNFFPLLPANSKLSGERQWQSRRVVSRFATERRSVEISYDESSGEFFASASHLPRIFLRQRIRGEVKIVSLRGDRTCIAHSCHISGGASEVVGVSKHPDTVWSAGEKLNPSVCHADELQNVRFFEAFILRSRPKAGNLQNPYQNHNSETNTTGITDGHKHNEHAAYSTGKKPENHRHQSPLGVGSSAIESNRSHSLKGETESAPLANSNDMKDVEAYLVVRDSEMFSSLQDQEVIAIPLSYKPLSLHVATIANSDASLKTTTAVIVASADDLKLRFYVQSNKAHEKNDDCKQQPFFEMYSSEALTESSSDDNSAFLSSLSLTSPIMAIDALEVSREGRTGHYNCLALGCQDGTIRVITFKCKSRSELYLPRFSLVSSSTFIVDGPIVSVRLSEGKEGVCLSVGSLYGFVCMFRHVDGSKRSSQGPHAVVEDLWDSHLDAEDSVFSVHYFCYGSAIPGTAIAVGTCSGRLLLLEPIEPKLSKARNPLTARYRLFWSCQLPYPIYGICSADVDGDGFSELFVTTRKTLHIFRIDKIEVLVRAKENLKVILKEKRHAKNS